MPQAGVKGRLTAVLFDLDGTLVDSAPDLAGTANDMRASRGLPPLPFADLRLHCGSGARGMLGTAFDAEPGQPHYAALRDEFHQRYEDRMLRQTLPFPAAAALLDALDSRRMRWAIVTNKAMRFAQPLTRALGLWPRAAALVGGDSTPFTKPHPAPLLEAARQMVLAPAACIYVGDDHRDVQAGRAAGMATAVAAWGYLGAGSAPDAWGADAVFAQPGALLTWLDLA